MKRLWRRPITILESDIAICKPVENLHIEAHEEYTHDTSLRICLSIFCRYTINAELKIPSNKNIRADIIMTVARSQTFSLHFVKELNGLTVEKKSKLLPIRLYILNTVGKICKKLLRLYLQETTCEILEKYLDPG